MSLIIHFIIYSQGHKLSLPFFFALFLESRAGGRGWLCFLWFEALGIDVIFFMFCCSCSCLRPPTPHLQDCSSRDVMQNSIQQQNILARSHIQKGLSQCCLNLIVHSFLKDRVRFINHKYFSDFKFHFVYIFFIHFL